MKEGKLKMQEVNFKTVEVFLDYLTEDELRMIEFLSGIIFDCAPNIHEKYRLVSPFIRFKSAYFIWPSSVLWGKKKTYTGVRFGFNCDYLLDDEINYLDKGNRKQVYYKNYTSLKDIDVELLKSNIYNAIEID